MDKVTDPVDRLAAADLVRADLAVVLTKVARGAAHQASVERRMAELANSQWRSQRYLFKMARQHRDANGLPYERVKDIITDRVLDLNDLRRLRGTR